jgi:hypothetical protein
VPAEVIFAAPKTEKLAASPSDGAVAIAAYAVVALVMPNISATANMAIIDFLLNFYVPIYFIFLLIDLLDELFTNLN